MAGNVLKELDILSNSHKPESEGSSVKEAPRSKLKPRQSLLKNFDPLYASPLKNVMELKPKVCAVKHEAENVAPLNSDLPLVDFATDEIKELPESPFQTDEIEKPIFTELEQNEVAVETRNLLDQTTFLLSDPTDLNQAKMNDDVENLLEKAESPLSNEANAAHASPANVLEQKVDVHEEGKKIAQPTQHHEKNPLTKDAQTILDAEVESTITEQPQIMKQNIFTIEKKLVQCEDLNQTILLANPSVVIRESDSPYLNVEESREPDDILEKDDDGHKKLDETIYFSPLKNVMEIRHEPSAEDTTIVNVTQQVICENSKPADVKKIETNDACTQCDEIKQPEVKVLPIVTDDARTLQYQQLLDQYETQINSEMSSITSMKEERATLQKHLTTLEVAFSDVHQKYERSKTILAGYRANEEILKQRLAEAESSILGYEETKKYMKEQMVESVTSYNAQIISERDKYSSEITKLVAIVKMLEIKVKSSERSLMQKTTECEDLMRLFNEVNLK